MPHAATASPLRPDRAKAAPLLAWLCLLLATPPTYAAEVPHVTGRVLSAGQPVSGADVELVRAGPELRAVTSHDMEDSLEVVSRCVTDAQGLFALPAEGSGAAALVVRAPGWAAFLNRRELFPLSSPTPASGVTLDLGEPARLEGAILDEQGEPATGVTIRAVARTWDGDWWATTTSDKRGRYGLQGLPQHARVVILARDHERADRDVRWTSAQPSRCSLFLTPDRMLRGRLLRRTAEGLLPLKGASVHVTVKPLDEKSDIGVRPPAVRNSTSDHELIRVHAVQADGSYEVHLPPGARAMGAHPGSAWTELSGGDQVLGAAEVLHLASRNPRGEPTPKIRLRTKDTPWVVTLDQEGTARWSSPIPSRGLEVLDARFPEPVAAGRGPSLALAQAWTLRGHVTRLDNELQGPSLHAPAAAARVRVRLIGGTVLEVATDARGEFIVPGLPPGDVVVSARHGQDVATGRGRDGRQLELRLEVAPSLSIHVSRESDKKPAQGQEPRKPVPVVQGEALFEPVGSALAPRRVRVSSTPTTVKALGGGTWNVVHWGPGIRSGATSVRLRASSTTVVPLPSRRQEEVTVQVLDPSGRPLLEARVELVSHGYYGNHDAPSTFLAGERTRDSTDGSGLARLILPDAHTRGFRVRRPGFSLGLGQASQTESPVTVTLASASKLRGIVLDPQRQPLAGASVALTVESLEDLPDGQKRALQEGLGPIESDSDGRFVLDLPAGRYKLKAGHARALASQSTEVVVDGARAVDVELVLAEGAALVGKVVNADGSPAIGATVAVEVEPEVRDQYVPPGPPKAATATDGTFVLEGLVPGSALTVHATLNENRSPPRVVHPGEEPVELRLVSLGVIEGLVTLDGMPVAAKVRCRERRSRKTNSDARDGSYRLSGLAEGAYNCVAENAEGIQRMEGVALPEGDIATVDFELRRFHELNVLVLAKGDGRPLEGIRLRVPDGHSAATDADGRAQLKLDPTADRQTLKASAGSHEALSKTLEPPYPTELTLTTARRPFVHLRGRVVDPTGAPVPGAALDGPAWGKADEQGEFELKTYRFGPAVLRGSSTLDKVYHVAELDVEVIVGEDLTSLTLSLAATPGADVLLTVVDDKGPAAAVSVTLKRVSDAVGLRGETDSTGRVSLKRVPPGRWQVLLSRHQQAKLSAGELEIADGEDIERTLTYPEGWRVTGRVVRRGEPVEAASIKIAGGPDLLVSSRGNLTYFGGGPTAARSGRDGAFEVGPVDTTAKTTRIEVRPPEPALPGDRRLVSLEVATGQEHVLVDIAGAQVSGTVTFQGRPVVGASVSATKNEGRSAESQEIRMRGVFFTSGGTSIRTYTDTEGLYILGGLEHDVRHDLVVTKEGLASVVRSFETRTAEQALDVTLEQAGGIRLRALSPTGDLITSSFKLNLQTPDGRRLTNVIARPVEGGEHVLDVAAEVYRYRAWRGAWADILGTLEPGRLEVLHWAPGGRLELTITGDGRPLQGASAKMLSFNGEPPDEHLRPDWIGRWSADAVSDSAGTMSFRHLPIGLFVVEIRHGDLRQQVSVQTSSGVTTRVDVELESPPEEGEALDGRTPP